MSTTHQPANFAADYLATWVEPAPGTRRAITEQIWDPAGRLSISSTGDILDGTDAIAEHISRVHDELIAGKGITFAYDQEVTSGDLLLLRWSMTAPNGAVIGRGADTVRFTEEGRVREAHMFMGVE